MPVLNLGSPRDVLVEDMHDAFRVALQRHREMLEQHMYFEPIVLGVEHGVTFDKEWRLDPKLKKASNYPKEEL